MPNSTVTLDRSGDRIPVPTSEYPKAIGQGAIFNGSPVLCVGGEARPAGTGNTDKVTGVVEVVKTNADISTWNLGSNDPGKVTVSSSSDAVYIMKLSGPLTLAQMGGGFSANLTAETATPASAQDEGSIGTKRMLNVSTIAPVASDGANQRQFIILAPAYTNEINPVTMKPYETSEIRYVRARINPANFQPAAG
jgi:hypothetical protein